MFGAVALKRPVNDHGEKGEGTPDKENPVERGDHKRRNIENAPEHAPHKARKSTEHEGEHDPPAEIHAAFTPHKKRRWHRRRVRIRARGTRIVGVDLSSRTGLNIRLAIVLFMMLDVCVGGICGEGAGFGRVLARHVLVLLGRSGAGGRFFSGDSPRDWHGQNFRQVAALT